MFRVGQRVVYIGPDFRDRIRSQNIPVPDCIYTIRAINEICGESAFLLNEINNEPRRWMNGTFELHMNAKFFRPAVETDISFAHEILRKVSKKQGADA